jgi:hypothetical protein
LKAEWWYTVGSVEEVPGERKPVIRDDDNNNNCNSAWTTTFLEQLIIIQIMKKFALIMEPEI